MFGTNFFYDMQLHFKSFNQMEFVSEIYCEFLKTFLFQDKNTNDQPTKFYWFLSSLRIKIIWMNSPICQLTILPSDTERIKHMKDDHVLHAFTVTVFLINFRLKLPRLLSQFTNDWTKKSQTRYSSSPVLALM